MFRIYTCLTVDHDWRLVALAGVVCLLASAVAISLFHRAQATAGRRQLIWVTLDAAAAGCGIWSTHFIAMLAYVPGADAGYDLKLTILSLLIAIFMTGAGLSLALLNFGRWAPALGGAVLGAGIAGMHYTGMMGLDLPAHITWSPDLVIASIAMGVVFGGLAVFFATRRDDWATTSIAIVLLTLAIVSMHFTGMSAVLAFPDPTRVVDFAALSTHSLSLFVAGATTIILGMCLVAALSNRRYESKLRQQKDLLDAALENMSQGLCMFNAEGRIVLFNERYTKLLGWSAAWLKGRYLIEIIRRRMASGELSGDPEALWRK